MPRDALRSMGSSSRQIPDTDDVYPLDGVNPPEQKCELQTRGSCQGAGKKNILESSLSHMAN